jgi:hypothetical protein
LGIFLIAALQQTNGNQTQTARILGVNRVAVWDHMKKYGIDIKKYKALKLNRKWIPAVVYLYESDAQKAKIFVTENHRLVLYGQKLKMQLNGHHFSPERRSNWGKTFQGERF